MKEKIKKMSVIGILLVVSMFACFGCAKKENTENDKKVSLSENDEYSPVSSVSLTDAEAAALNNSVKVKLYYKTAKGDKLSCETKLLQFTDKDRKADVLAGKIIELLIAGPSNSNLVKTIPEGTVLNSVKVKGNVVYVDFNEAFAGAAKGNDAAFIAYSIANTLTEFKNVNEVAVTAGGNRIETEAGCNFSKLNRNMELVTDLASAAPEADYSENVFLEIELE